MVVAGTHINHKYYDDFVFIYYLDYDITCDVKWIKKSYFFDGIYDVAFVGDNQICCHRQQYKTMQFLKIESSFAIV